MNLPDKETLDAEAKANAVAIDRSNTLLRQMSHQARTRLTDIKWTGIESHADYWMAYRRVKDEALIIEDTIQHEQPNPEKRSELEALLMPLTQELNAMDKTANELESFTKLEITHVLDDAGITDETNRKAMIDAIQFDIRFTTESALFFNGSYAEQLSGLWSSPEPIDEKRSKLGNIIKQMREGTPDDRVFSQVTLKYAEYNRPNSVQSYRS